MISEVLRMGGEMVYAMAVLTRLIWMPEALGSKVT
jgi:hypothetical protein